MRDCPGDCVYFNLSLRWHSGSSVIILLLAPMGSNNHRLWCFYRDRPVERELEARDSELRSVT